MPILYRSPNLPLRIIMLLGARSDGLPPARNQHLLNSSDPYVSERSITVDPLIELVANYTTNWNQSTNVTSESETTSNETILTTRPPLPLTQLYERCWCDLVSSLLLSDLLNPTFSKRIKDKKPAGLAVLFPPSGFFDPFDQKGWESASLVRHARKISPPPPSHSQTVEEILEQTPSLGPAPEEETEAEKPLVDQMEGSTWRAKIRMRNMLNPVHSRWRALLGSKTEAPTPTPPQNDEAAVQVSVADTKPATQDTQAEATSAIVAPTEKESAPSPPSLQLPIPFWLIWVKLWRKTVDFFGKKYDLTPYGYPVVIDFGWGRW